MQKQTECFIPVPIHIHQETISFGTYNREAVENKAPGLYLILYRRVILLDYIKISCFITSKYSVIFTSLPIFCLIEKAVCYYPEFSIIDFTKTGTTKIDYGKITREDGLKLKAFFILLTLHGKSLGFLLSLPIIDLPQEDESQHKENYQ